MSLILLAVLASGCVDRTPTRSEERYIELEGPTEAARGASATYIVRVVNGAKEPMSLGAEPGVRIQIEEGSKGIYDGEQKWVKAGTVTIEPGSVLVLGNFTWAQQRSDGSPAGKGTFLIRATLLTNATVFGEVALRVS